jgi:hypothetical protein
MLRQERLSGQVGSDEELATAFGAGKEDGPVVERVGETAGAALAGVE